jgi:alkylation response protein AidB-like acyl-CoA dehydrogenase
LPIDFTPSDEQALVVETVRQFAANEIRPRARAADEARKPADEAIQAAHALGLVANGLPAEHGGGGERSAVLGVLVAEELAWGDLASALAILSPALVAFPVADQGSPAQQKSLLPRYARDSVLPGSLALREPGFGADVFARARGRSEGGLRPRWSRHGALARAATRAVRRRGGRQLFVPRDAAGLAIAPEWYMASRRYRRWSWRSRAEGACRRATQASAPISHD